MRRLVNPAQGLTSFGNSYVLDKRASWFYSIPNLPVLWRIALRDQPEQAEDYELPDEDFLKLCSHYLVARKR